MRNLEVHFKILGFKIKKCSEFFIRHEIINECLFKLIFTFDALKVSITFYLISDISTTIRVKAEIIFVQECNDRHIKKTTHHYKINTLIAPLRIY